MNIEVCRKEIIFYCQDIVKVFTINRREYSIKLSDTIINYINSVEWKVLIKSKYKKYENKKWICK